MPFCAIAQKEGNIWYFGNDAGLDFNSGAPVPLTNGKLTTLEGCASIANRHGNLLFYTDGLTVYDKSHSVMANGTGLLGHFSASQSAVIVPHPDSAHIFYVFTTSGVFNLAYSVIDTTQASGLGAVVTKNVALMPDGTEKLTAVKHPNNHDVWVVSHQKGNSDFYAYLVTSSGVNHTPVVSSAGASIVTGSVGCMKFSPDGTKMVFADYGLGVEMFDFNPATGVVSNPRTLTSSLYYYGVEFSPSGRYLYLSTLKHSVTGSSEVYQLDLKAGNWADILASKVQLGTITNFSPAALQLGPDGKIYIALYNGSTFLGIIRNPENAGTACGYSQTGLYLGGKSSAGGLPCFIQSYFYKANIQATHSVPACGGLTFNIFNTGDTGDIISSKWDYGDGKTGAGKKTTHTYSTHGTYTIKNIIEIGGPKPSVDTLVIVLKTLPNPDVRIHRVAQNHCFEGNYFTLADSSRFADSLLYKSSVWTFSDTVLQKLNASSVMRNYFNEGQYIVKLSVTASNNCKDSTTDTLMVYPSAYALIITGGDNCANNNKFTPSPQTSINAPGAITGYLWGFGDGTTSSQTLPQKTYADTGTYKITLIAYEKNGCNDTATGSFTVLPAPKVEFTADDVCDKDSLVVKNTSFITKGNLNYTWKYGDGNTGTGFENKHLYADTGKYLVTLIAISDSLCTDTFEKEIYIKPKPVADFSVTGNCTQNLVDFTDKSVRYTIPVKNNKWIFGDGNTGNSSADIQHIYTTQNQYLVKLVTEADNGCKDSIIKPLFINPKPAIDFTINTNEQCLKGNTFVFTNTTTIPSGNINGYNWLIDGTNAATTTNYNRVFTSPATYNIRLTAESDSNCFDSITKVIVVNPQVKKDIIINDTTQCKKGNVFTITNNSTVNGTGTIVNYNWLFSDNATSTSPVPQSKTFGTSGTHWVQCIMETDQGCLDTFKQNLEVYFTPTINFNAQNVCLGDEVLFDNTTPDPNNKIIKWQWDFGDGSKSALKSPARKYPAAGNYLINLIATTSDGCADTMEKFFPNLVSLRPTAYFEDSVLGSSGIKTMYRFTNGSSGATQYQWDFGDGTLSNDENPEKTFEDVGHFLVSLTAENQYGCRDQYSKKLFVVPDMEVVIPNAFTPNNRDDLNPVFKVEGLYLTKEFSMDIFNRWGERVFATDKITTGWDGMYAGQASPPGMYMYVIRVMDLKNKVNVYYGSFVLLR